MLCCSNSSSSSRWSVDKSTKKKRGAGASGAGLGTWATILTIIYDTLASCISIADVASDIYVTYQFYQAGQDLFFGISLTIFGIAQICYGLLFVFLFAEGKSTRFHFLTFLCVMPFGMLVPMFIWIQTFRFRWLDAMLECFGLDPDTSSQHQSSNDQQDPLQTYIQEKFRRHGGFVVESIVESVPQSILQMIFIVVMGQHVSWVNVFSLTVSMVSVASKGLMLSYSIDRPTFSFNFSCFVADVFGIFCTVSWLFYTTGKQNTHDGHTVNIPFLEKPVDILSAIWFYKEFAIVSVIVLLGVGLLALFVLDDMETRSQHNGPNPRFSCRKYTVGVLMFAFTAMLFPPFMVVIEGVKLSLLPIFITRSFDSRHGKNARFYGPLFAFFRSGDDFVGKMAEANQFMAEKCLERRVPQYGRGARQSKHAAVRSQATQLLSVPPSEITLRQIRKLNGYTVERLLHAYLSLIGNEIKKGDDECSCSDRLAITLFALFIYVFVPMWVLGVLYSIFFPILSTAMTPLVDTGLLQLTLSSIYICALVVVILLTGHVYRFKRCTIHLMMFGFDNNARHAWVEQIVDRYHARKAAKQRDQFIRAGCGCDLPRDITETMIAHMPQLQFVDKHAPTMVSEERPIGIVAQCGIDESLPPPQI